MVRAAHSSERSSIYKDSVMASVNKVVLDKMYRVEMKSIPDIAKEIGVSTSRARRMLIESGVSLRSRADGVRAARDKLGKYWMGKKREFSVEHREKIRAARLRAPSAGISKKPNGYIEFTRGPNKSRSQHVVLMESRIGRRLNSDEVVHHIDGNRANNSIENLQLMTRSEHTSLHRKGEHHGKR